MKKKRDDEMHEVGGPIQPEGIVSEEEFNREMKKRKENIFRQESKRMIEAEKKRKKK